MCIVVKVGMRKRGIWWWWRWCWCEYQQLVSECLFPVLIFIATIILIFSRVSLSSSSCLVIITSSPSLRLMRNQVFRWWMNENGQDSEWTDVIISSPSSWLNCRFRLLISLSSTSPSLPQRLFNLESMNFVTNSVEIWETKTITRLRNDDWIAGLILRNLDSESRHSHKPYLLLSSAKETHRRWHFYTDPLFLYFSLAMSTRTMEHTSSWTWTSPMTISMNNFYLHHLHSRRHKSNQFVSLFNLLLGLLFVQFNYPFPRQIMGNNNNINNHPLRCLG